MLLILADHSDRVARDVAARVTAVGGGWRWLSPLDLATARWTHRVAGSGDAEVTTRIRTAAGSSVEVGSFTGVLNRVSWLPPVPYSRPDDREYALMERHALLTSVLAAITVPVANSVRPPSLSGPVFDTVSWLGLAASVSIPARGMRLATDGRRWRATGWLPLDWQMVTTAGGQDVAPLHAAVPVGRRPVAWAEPVGHPHRVTVAGDQAFGAPDPTWEQHCIQLASAADCLLLQVTLAPRASDGEWVVVGAEPTPERISSPAVVALAQLLGGGRASSVVDGERLSS